MRYRRPFVLFKKTLNSGTRIWYYYIYENNKRRQYSTGSTTRAPAEKYCLSLYKTNSLYTEKKKVTPTFAEYTKNWFVYDSCTYIQQKLMRGFHFTHAYADRRRNDLVRYAIPFFGKYKIEEITPELANKWVHKLQTANKLSNATVNKIVKGIKIIFSDAYKKGDIKINLSPNILMLKNNSKTHGIYTKNEIEKLLNPEKIEEIWNGSKLHYVLNLLGSKTGMRLGEIQGLQKKNVHPEHILVEHSWESTYGLKDTKTHKSRIIPISKELYDVIQDLAKEQTEGEFIFSKNMGEKPITRTSVAKKLKTALNRIGITEEEQRHRYLTFHSYRHYVNSLLINSGLPISIVQSIIGHVNDDAMTEHYTHVSLEDEKQMLKFV